MNIQASGKCIEITHPDRVIFPHDNITKLHLIQYYATIGSIMVKHTKNRLISMHRFVDDIDHPGFYQKDVSDYFPAWIKRHSVIAQDGHAVNYMTINNVATLLYITNQLCVTPHLWLSSMSHIDIPNRMIFDLDPSPGVPFSMIIEVAGYLHALLTEAKLSVFLMTTGSRGVHVVVPIKPQYSFIDVRTYAHNIAAKIVAHYPRKATIEMRKEKRGRKVFIDVMRNAFGQTSVAPYAVRALQGAPVAAPVMLDELEKKITCASFFTIDSMLSRIDQCGDLWTNINRSASTLKL